MRWGGAGTGDHFGGNFLWLAGCSVCDVVFDKIGAPLKLPGGQGTIIPSGTRNLSQLSPQSILLGFI